MVTLVTITARLKATSVKVSLAAFVSGPIAFEGFLTKKILCAVRTAEGETEVAEILSSKERESD